MSYQIVQHTMKTKRIKYAFLFFILFFFTACATPFKKDVAIRATTQNLNIDVTVIIDVFDCSYVLANTSTRIGDWRDCTLVLTHTGIYLYDGVYTDYRLNPVWHLPFSKMQGVDLLTQYRASDIHILYSEYRILAFTLIKSRYFYDQESVEKLYKFILDKGVAKFKAKGMIQDMDRFWF